MQKNPYAALRYPEFVYQISSTLLLTAAILIQEVIIGYELYKLTHDPLTLGMLGLVEALPYISIALFGGYYADRLDKRWLMKVSLLVIIASSVTLAATLKYIHLSVSNLTWVVYILFAIISFAKGIYSPASSSLKAFLTPREFYSNAASWNSTFWQIGAIGGPAFAGFAYVYFGLVDTLWLVVGLLILCLGLIFQISAKPLPEQNKPNEDIWTSIKEGFVFVLNNKILLYSISLDLVAVLFGGVIAILPIFAEDILKVGAEGLGILRAAPSVGAVLTVLVTAYYSPMNRAWQNMIIAVSGFGVATFVFALSTNIWLSVAMLFLTGAFDSISVVIRQTILQVVPPDHIRGRVISVNSIFVSSSNEIGAFESGVAAKILGTVPSVVTGSVATIAVVTWVYFKSKELLKVKIK